MAIYALTGTPATGKTSISKNLDKKVLHLSDLYSEASVKKSSSGEWIVDLEKLNEERLEKCFDTFELGVRLNFYEFRGGIDKSLEINKAMLAKGILCDMDNSNLNCFENRKYVIFKGPKGYSRGIMDVEVISIDQ